MAERRENSVLFSLSELRRLEEDRVRQEEADQQARAEAERRARAEAEQQARDAEDARRRASEEFAMRERLERERMGREEGLRLQEAERRARIEAESRLQEQRMHLEMTMRAAANKAPPVKLILSAAGALVLVVAGLGYYMYQRHEQETAALIAEKRRAEEATRKAEQEKIELAHTLDDLEKRLANASSEEERKRIQQEIERVKAHQQPRVVHNGRSNPAAPDKPHKPQLNIGGDSNDPLQGL
jgi:hypothetical protein